MGWDGMAQHSPDALFLSSRWCLRAEYWPATSWRTESYGAIVTGSARGRLLFLDIDGPPASRTGPAGRSARRPMPRRGGRRRRIGRRPRAGRDLADGFLDPGHGYREPHVIVQAAADIHHQGLALERMSDHGEHGKKPRRRRSFTREFKAEIVGLCRQGDRSVRQVARDFYLT